MSKNKANIALSNLGEVSTSGPLIALRKGINELINRRQKRQAPVSAPNIKVKYKRLLSVIICTASRTELAAAAARSIANQNFDKSLLELIVVNNSSKPFPKELLPPFATLVTEETQGLSLARNKGAKTANGEYLLFIDDDAIATEGLLSAMFSAFENHSASIIGGQIELKLPTPVPSVFLEGKEALWSGYTVPYKSYREVREQYEFPYGACFAVRHSVLDFLGGFSANFGRCGDDYAGGEETALCFAAKNHGLKIAVEPKARVLHCVSPHRFTKEHIKQTLRAGILTTHRLYLDGYSKVGWTASYIEERIHIIKKELKKLQQSHKELAAYYKECELSAFLELYNTYFKR